MIECSIGVMAYNEEGSIGRLLESVLNQKSEHVRIKEIIVIASGCTDSTVQITESFLAQDTRIRLFVQPEREGKVSAIKLFLSKCHSDIVMIANGDLFLEEHAVDRLVSPFADSLVGMTGGRAISENDANTFMGFAAHFLWDMHHEISLKFPKLGELVAYRKIKNLSFPDDTASDEGIIEACITAEGYKLKYVPEAICYNRGPVVLAEYMKRRINIFAGHIQLMRRKKYAPSTMDVRKLTTTLFPKIAALLFKNARCFVWISCVIALECFARFMAHIDFYIRRIDLSRWEVAKSARIEKKCLG
jgi:poly-beta-1,6-N-acetyl-D-glucosamine synthase